ncbi:hypothetical protein LBMAG15_19600 [Actinomycetes bacterium]|nr:hypothetical protein LBMAG15_19600 [Actinomycetes bacterium]
MSPLIGLSSSSVYPENTPAAFEIAAALGYDGIEVMVGTDSVSQDLEALAALVDHYQVPVISIHAPCLLVTQRVWGTDSWVKLRKAQATAEVLGASTVVVHPPFRWQREYARTFVSGLEAMRSETDVQFAVENMFPWRAVAQRLPAYSPGWDIRDEDYPHTTLDLSHTAVSGSDAMQFARDLGERLTHLHLADGSGSALDEHLIPGRGTQPAGEVLGLLAATAFTGSVIVEVSTRGAGSREQRVADLTEALSFARRHLSPSVNESGTP